MNPNDFAQLLHSQPAPVVLLEGTRDLPPDDAPHLTTFARDLASSHPHAIFRTGNALGSDEAFAQGICEVDAARLQYIVPHASHRRKMRHPDALCVSLEQLDEAHIEALLQQTERATPSYAFLIQQRAHNVSMRIKLDYLLRDALKVVGVPAHSIAPATFGVFYVNARNPGKGGTGHTLRVCECNNVPTWTQNEWLNRP